MHSSRMRTGRSLTVCCSLLAGGWGVPGLGGVPGSGGLLSGGCLVWGRGVPGRGGLLPEGGGLLWGGAWSGGVCSWGGVSAPRGCLLRGVSQHALRQTPPVDRHTLVKILPWPNFVAAGNNYNII